MRLKRSYKKETKYMKNKLMNLKFNKSMIKIN